MAEQAAVINYPEWSDYRKKDGLDPLGMRTAVSVFTRHFFQASVTLRCACATTVFTPGSVALTRKRMATLIQNPGSASSAAPKLSMH